MQHLKVRILFILYKISNLTKLNFKETNFRKAERKNEKERVGEFGHDYMANGDFANFPENDFQKLELGKERRKAKKEVVGFNRFRKI